MIRFGIVFPFVVGWSFQLTFADGSRPKTSDVAERRTIQVYRPTGRPRYATATADHDDE
jgi:hypothetical protein